MMLRHVVLGVDGIKQFLLRYALHLVFVDECLVEFLARSNAGDLDGVGGAVRAVFLPDGIGESLDGAGRCFSDENFATDRVFHCVQNQSNRLVEGQQKTGHLGHGDGKRFAVFDLAFEKRDD